MLKTKLLLNKNKDYQIKSVEDGIVLDKEIVLKSSTGRPSIVYKNSILSITLPMEIEFIVSRRVKRVFITDKSEIPIVLKKILPINVLHPIFKKFFKKYYTILVQQADTNPILLAKLNMTSHEFAMACLDWMRCEATYYYKTEKAKKDHDNISSKT